MIFFFYSTGESELGTDAEAESPGVHLGGIPKGITSRAEVNWKQTSLNKLKLGFSSAAPPVGPRSSRAMINTPLLDTTVILSGGG